MQLVGPIHTKFAGAAHRDNPLDACPIANLPKILDIRMDSYDLPSSFVASNAFGRILHLDTKICPLIVDQALV